MTRENRVRALTVAIGLLALAASPALADTFQVTNDYDSGPGSLREAITQAEANGVADDITFDADYTIFLASTLPDITTDVTIRGNGWGQTVIDGGWTPDAGGGVRAFRVTTGFLTLDAVTVRNCNDSAVVSWSTGQLLVTNSRLSQNNAVYGGAISGGGPVTVTSTSFIDNASNGGGAIYFDGPTLEVTGCTFSGNNATGASAYLGWGGAVGVRGGSATAILTNCTFNGNNAERRGGAIYLDYNASATLSFLTISGNTDGIDDAGIHVQDSATTAEITHSIITDYCSDDGSGASLTSLGYNLDMTNTCGFSAATNDLIGVDPFLGPLQDNGGPTHTMALPVSSQAVDAGAASGGAVTTDQRGWPRPSDGDGSGTSECDMGAYEYQDPVIFADGFENGSTDRWDAAVTS